MGRNLPAAPEPRSYAAGMPTWKVGALEVTRVADPAFELVLPQDEATVAILQQAPWLQPEFVTEEWALQVGSSATIVASAGTVVLIDPFLAFDDPDRLGARLTALRQV